MLIILLYVLLIENLVDIACKLLIISLEYMQIKLKVCGHNLNTVDVMSILSNIFNEEKLFWLFSISMEKDFQSLVFETTVHTMAVGESWINTYSICVTEDLVKSCNVSTDFIIFKNRWMYLNTYYIWIFYSDFLIVNTLQATRISLYKKKKFVAPKLFQIRFNWIHAWAKLGFY